MSTAMTSKRLCNSAATMNRRHGTSREMECTINTKAWRNIERDIDKGFRFFLSRRPTVKRELIYGTEATS